MQLLMKKNTVLQNTILVDNVLETLTTISETIIDNNLGISIIGLTGSNGKTTTKELINSVLK